MATSMKTKIRRLFSIALSAHRLDAPTGVVGNVVASHWVTIEADDDTTQEDWGIALSKEVQRLMEQTFPKANGWCLNQFHMVEVPYAEMKGIVEVNNHEQTGAVEID